MTDQERRAKRKEEFGEAASIRERALKMQREAEGKSKKQFKQFFRIDATSKRRSNCSARALNMDPSEFSRKIFKKTIFNQR